MKKWIFLLPAIILILISCDPERCTYLKMENDSDVTFDVTYYYSNSEKSWTESAIFPSGDELIVWQLCDISTVYTYPEDLGIDSIQFSSDQDIDKTFGMNTPGYNPMVKENWDEIFKMKKYGSTLNLVYTISNSHVAEWR